MTLPKPVAELLIQKLDLEHITAAYARQFAFGQHGVKFEGRSREDVANNIMQLQRSKRMMDNSSEPQQTLPLELED